ncbi:MAG: hypothetical protein MAG794_01703 [Gammaproteobacteria bacterium]|nr:hypothetical protein [Gammaproteobacteria bacterium]
MTDTDIQSWLNRIPRFRGMEPDSIRSEPLAGLTNLNYLVEIEGQRFVLRVPGEGTSEYIDRAVEAHNARIAAGAEVGAEVEFFDADSGLMLTRYLDGCATMSPELFAERDGAPARAAEALKRMHECGREFRFRFELFGMIDEYLGMLERLGATLPDGYHDTVAEAGTVRRVLEANPGRLVPCHCDPLCENFLDNGKRMWVVDWEYSGMNDPIWDLGDLSVEAGFDERRDAEMMQAYCGGPPPDATRGRMIVYKAMCDLLWTLWGLLQHANDNPAEDFWAYSVNRFERCKRLMGADDFGRHLEAVRRGA